MCSIERKHVYRNGKDKIFSLTSQRSIFDIVQLPIVGHWIGVLPKLPKLAGCQFPGYFSSGGFLSQRPCPESATYQLP